MRNNGIRWTLLSTLEDLDDANDLALLSHTYQQMQAKTDRLNNFSSLDGLKINHKKSEVMVLNTTTMIPVKVDNKDLPNSEKFTYLGSSLTPDGGSKEDIQNRLNKARIAFYNMTNIWKSCQYSTRTKLIL